MDKVNELMRRGIADKIFPGAVLLVSKNQDIVFFEAYGTANLFTQRPITRETFFDLASLTKPLTTTLAVMSLVQEGRLTLDQRLAALLPGYSGTDKALVTVEQLLAHHAGLPAYRPYYLSLCRRPPEERRARLGELLSAEPLIHPIGCRPLYSDLGFMLLQQVVETVSGKSLSCFVRQKIYRPLGLDGLFFPAEGKPLRRQRFAATERCLWRGVLLEGVVHDENAYAMGGVAGHSGLFGKAAHLHLLVKALYAAYAGERRFERFDRQLLKHFFSRYRDSDRALGFDTPARENSSTGRYMSRNSVGHLGFTGTSFWLDLDEGIAVILLTNRVHPTRANEGIRRFRPALHDTVFSALHEKRGVSQSKHRTPEPLLRPGPLEAPNE